MLLWNLCNWYKLTWWRGPHRRVHDRRHVGSPRGRHHVGPAARAPWAAPSGPALWCWSHAGSKPPLRFSHLKKRQELTLKWQYCQILWSRFSSWISSTYCRVGPCYRDSSVRFLSADFVHQSTPFGPFFTLLHFFRIMFQIRNSYCTMATAKNHIFCRYQRFKTWGV